MGQPARTDPARDFERLIRSLDRRERWRVFGDFCELGAMALANRVLKSQAREDRYLNLIARYDKDEQPVFGQMLGCVCQALAEAEGRIDFLGDAFQGLELASHWHGQFFTPMSLCHLMAEMSFDGVEDIIRAHGFATVAEPACGAGAMLIAAASVLRARNIAPEHHMWVSATDIDPTAAYMCFIQLSLLGVPAEVVVGDTLRMKFTEVLRTPEHITGLWDARLRARWAIESIADDKPALPAPEVNPAPAATSQLRMF